MAVRFRVFQEGPRFVSAPCDFATAVVFSARMNAARGMQTRVVPDSHALRLEFVQNVFMEAPPPAACRCRVCQDAREIQRICGELVLRMVRWKQAAGNPPPELRAEIDSLDRQLHLVLADHFAAQTLSTVAHDRDVDPSFRPPAADAACAEMDEPEEGRDE